MRVADAGLDVGEGLQRHRCADVGLALQAGAPGEHGGRGVERIAHPHGLRVGRGEAVGIDRRHAHFDQAGQRRRQPQAAGAVERHALPGDGVAQRAAAHLHADAADVGKAAGPHGGQHGLPRQHRSARGQVDEDLWRIGLVAGHHAQGQAARAGVAPVADMREDDEVADLAGARGPVQQARGGVIARAFGQVVERDHQVLRLQRTVRVAGLHRACDGAAALEHRQVEALADDEGVVARRQHRWAVDVEYTHLHRPLRLQHAVADAEVEGERLAVALGVVDAVGVRRPLEVTGVGIEQHALRRVGVVQQRDLGCVAVGVGAEQREVEGLALLDQLQRHRQQHRRLVDVAHHQIDVAADAGGTVAGAQRQAIVTGGSVVGAALGGEQPGGPAQAGSRLAVAADRRFQGHAGRQPGHGPVEVVEVGVVGDQVECDGNAFVDRGGCQRAGQRGVGEAGTGGCQGDQVGRLVAGPHDDAHVLRRGVRRRDEIGRQRYADIFRRQPAVGDCHADCVGAELRRTRRPADVGRAVLRIAHQPGAGRQPVGAEAERVLVAVADADRDAQFLADHSHHLRRQRELRWHRQAAHADNEALRLRLNLVDVAVAVVLRGDAEGVVAALAGGRCEVDRALAVAALNVAGKRRQAGDRQRDRVAVGIGGADRDVQRHAGIDEGIGDVADGRRPVGVAHHDGQRDLAGQRHARVVAGIGGGDSDVVGAGLAVARGPDQFQRIGVEAGAVGQAADLVADRRRGARRVGELAGRGETELGLEGRIVGVEGEDADPQRLAFEHVPGLRRIEHRRAVGVQHLEGHVDPRLRDHRCRTVGRPEGGRKRHRHDVVAGLRVAGCPGDPAGVGVQRGAQRQPARRITQADRAAVGLREAARDLPVQLQAEAVAFTQRLRGHRQQQRLGVALHHMHVEAPQNRRLGVAGQHRDVAVVAGLVVAWRPAQQAGGGIEARARRQVAHHDGDDVAVFVAGGQCHVQGIAFGQRDVADRAQQRRMIAAGDRDAEGFHRHAAAAVDQPDHRGGVGQRIGTRRPVQLRRLRVAAVVENLHGPRRQHQTRRALHDLPEELGAVDVAGLQGRHIGLADLRGRQRHAGGVQRIGVAQGRRCVLVGHRIHAVPEVELHQAVGAGAVEGRQRPHRDRLIGQRGAHRELAARSQQRRIEVDHPQVGLVAGQALRAVDDIREVASRIEQQHQRPVQIVDTQVGDGHVVADGAGGHVGPRVAECQPQLRAQVEHRGEGGGVVACQGHQGGAEQLVRDLQLPHAGSEARQAQDRRVRHRVPGDAGRMQGQGGLVSTGHQRVIGGVQHRTGRVVVVARQAQPHRLVELHGYLVQGQRQQGAVGHRGGQNQRRLERRQLVDVRRLTDQHAAIAGRQNGLPARAAAGQLQAPVCLQLDRPDAARVRQRRGAAVGCHRPLRDRGGDQQQACHRRAGLAECEAQHDAGHAVFDLGAALGAAAHREADDVGGAARRAGVDVAAGPAHRPQAAVGAEGEIAHALVGEMRPRAAGRVENLDAIARRHVQQATRRIDRQRMRQRVAGLALVAFEHRAAAGIDQQQFGAGHDPELALAVQRHVEHRTVEFEQGSGAAATIAGEVEDLVAQAAGTGEHAAVGQLDHRLHADVGLAGAEAARKSAQGQRGQHRLQVTGLRARDIPRQGQCGLLKNRVRDIAAPGRSRRQLRRAADLLELPQRRLCGLPAAVVGQHRIADAGRLAVARLVGCRGEELVVLAGDAGEQRGACGAGHLALPDAEIAAVFGDVDRHVLDAAGVVAGRPAHVVDRIAGGVGAARLNRQHGGWRRGIQRQGLHGAVLRRQRVEEDTRLGPDAGARLGDIERADGVAERGLERIGVAGIRCQQPAQRVVQHLAGVGVDRLDEPGRHSREAVDAGAHAQHETLVAAEVEVALEHRLVGRHVDVDVADLQVAQAQAARVEAGV